MKAYSFDGASGETIRERPIPAGMQAQCEEKRTELIEKLAEVDEDMAEKFLGEEKVDAHTLQVGTACLTLPRLIFRLRRVLLLVYALI